MALLGFLIFPLAAVVLGARAVQNSRNREAGDSLAMGALIAGAIELALVVAALFILPQMGRPRPLSQQVRCASNLRQIGQAIQMYANANGGEFPPDFDTLVQTQDLTSVVFNCPESNDEPAIFPTTAPAPGPVFTHGTCSYVYLRPLKKIDAVGPDDLLAYEPLSNHHKGINALFADGHVDFIPQAAAKNLLAHLTTQPVLPP